MLTVGKGGERHGIKQDGEGQGKGVCVWKEWEDRGRMSEAGEKADHEQKGSQCVHKESTEFCPYKVIMHVCKKGRGTGCSHKCL